MFLARSGWDAQGPMVLGSWEPRQDSPWKPLQGRDHLSSGRRDCKLHKHRRLRQKNPSGQQIRVLGLENSPFDTNSLSGEPFKVRRQFPSGRLLFALTPERGALAAAP